MSPEELETIQAVAEACDGADWFMRDRPTDDGLTVVEDGRQDGMFPITCETMEAVYISTVSPAVALRLATEIATLRAELAGMAHEIERLRARERELMRMVLDDNRQVARALRGEQDFRVACEAIHQRTINEARSGFARALMGEGGE